jgi:hypothetical protein
VNKLGPVRSTGETLVCRMDGVSLERDWQALAAGRNQ